MTTTPTYGVGRTVRTATYDAYGGTYADGGLFAWAGAV